jgi:hypothetical protein
MKIIGQPADYSEMLQRVFWFSAMTGIICTFLLAQNSPAIQEFLDSVSTQVDFGPLKSIKILYILVPAAIALLSRIIKLHDRISNVFRIRFTFDTKFFLFPLCEGANVVLTSDKKRAIKKSREESMYATVYKYAGFKNPVIDCQLVRTAADNWGWFWVFVESSFLVGLTAAFFTFRTQWGYTEGLLWVLLVECVLLWIQWRACIRSARPQVKAILDDQQRFHEIRNYFNNL